MSKLQVDESVVQSMIANVDVSSIFRLVAHIGKIPSVRAERRSRGDVQIQEIDRLSAISDVVQAVIKGADNLIIANKLSSVGVCSLVAQADRMRRADITEI